MSVKKAGFQNRPFFYVNPSGKFTQKYYTGMQHISYRLFAASDLA